MTTILQSEKLTTLLEDKGKMKAGAAASRSEAWQLEKLRSPQILDTTVIRYTDPETPTAAYIGIKKRPEQGVAFTGPNEQDQAARREDDLQRTLKGESLADSTGIEEKLARTHRKWSAQEDAILHLDREIAAEKSKLAAAYCKQRKPDYHDMMRRLCKPLLEVHAVWSELYGLKRHLIDNEAGLRGICSTMPDFLGSPNDKHSEFADFIMAAKREGYINSLPKAFQP
jgi:hypothetical protein